MKREKSTLGEFELYYEETTLPTYLKKRTKRTLKQIRALRLTA